MCFIGIVGADETEGIDSRQLCIYDIGYYKIHLSWPWPSLSDHSTRCRFQGDLISSQPGRIDLGIGRPYR